MERLTLFIKHISDSPFELGCVLSSSIDHHLSGTDSVRRFAVHRPYITLMDLRLPDISGLDAITQIRQRFPQAPMIVLTTCKGDVQALRALEAGAMEYLLKSMLRRYMLDTIRALHADQNRIPPEIATEWLSLRPMMR